ncbi:MAG: hypothetical protein ACKV1O_01605 [Saprospiraceae bacterium]
MTTIEVKPGTRVGIDDILTGVANLEIEELDKFVDKLLALRAKRVAPNLSKEETFVLKKINRGLPSDRKKRLIVLEAKRSAGTLNVEDQQELLAIIDELEQLNVERVHYLGELALMRGIPVRELMKQLGIRPQPYA